MPKIKKLKKGKKKSNKKRELKRLLKKQQGRVIINQKATNQMKLKLKKF